MSVAFDFEAPCAVSLSVSASLRNLEFEFDGYCNAWVFVEFVVLVISPVSDVLLHKGNPSRSDWKTAHHVDFVKRFEFDKESNGQVERFVFPFLEVVLETCVS